MATVAMMRERRAALAAEIERAKAEYEQIERVLASKMRSIDMDVGALKLLDELLAEAQSEAPAEQ